jgi:hypothetical protein
MTNDELRNAIIFKTVVEMTERHATQVPAPPACKPTGWKRCASGIYNYSIYKIANDFVEVNNE